MAEIDFIRELANPFFALLIAFLLVAILAFCFYKVLLKSENKQKTIKCLNVIAELCAVVGLIGLLTFAGRSKLDFNEHMQNVASSRAFSTLHEKFTAFHKNTCKPFDYQNTSPTLKNAAYKNICTFISNYEKNQNPNIYWGDFQSNVAEMSKNNTLTDEQLKIFIDLSDKIKKYLQARHNANVEPIESLNIKNNAPWFFLLSCFFIALTGVSIKCARALFDWFSKSCEK